MFYLFNHAFILQIYFHHYFLKGKYIGFLYIYNALQCPMEAIHGRQSLWHNILSAGTIGYVGFSRGWLGIPFIHPYTFYKYQYLNPGVVCFAVYGAIGGAFGAIAGKSV